jgi:hypothetical protein
MAELQRHARGPAGNGEKLLSSIGPGDEGDRLIAEGIQEFGWGESRARRMGNRDCGCGSVVSQEPEDPSQGSEPGSGRGEGPAFGGAPASEAQSAHECVCVPGARRVKIIEEAGRVTSHDWWL